VEGTTHVRIAGVVTLYHPPPSVIGNIGTYLPEVDVLYVFDNSPGNAGSLWRRSEGWRRYGTSRRVQTAASERH